VSGQRFIAAKGDFFLGASKKRSVQFDRNRLRRPETTESHDSSEMHSQCASSTATRGFLHRGLPRNAARVGSLDPATHLTSARDESPSHTTSRDRIPARIIPLHHTRGCKLPQFLKPILQHASC
jgi:hypothetical protein